MTHISCTRPGTAEPWSVLAVFSELFYQHRAAGFSEGREQHITTLHRSLWSVSASAYLQGSLALSHSTTQQLQPLQFWLKTICCCPTGVLRSGNGKVRPQIQPAVQEHQLPAEQQSLEGAREDAALRIPTLLSHIPRMLCDKNVTSQTITLLSVLPPPPLSSEFLSFPSSNSASPIPEDNVQGL